MKALWLLVLLPGLVGCTTQAPEKRLAKSPAPTQQIRVGRYVTTCAKATLAEINPLAAQVTVHFPPQVTRVGEALQQVLAPTGYQLAPHPSKALKQTLAKPLPATQRQLGPMSVKAILTVLLGPSVYTLEQDPLHRWVNAKLKPAMQSKGTLSDAKGN